jgi:MFS family permease
MFKSLRSFNFRIYYFTQGFSFVGNLVQEVALSWLIYKLTGESFYVGLIFFLKQLTSFFLSPFAGVLSDRISRQRLLTITNSIAVMLAILMGIVTVADHLVLPLLLCIQLLNGIISGIDTPVRQAFVKDLVADDKNLMNAIALNSSLYNIARISGPIVAGFLIPTIGEGLCFVLNGLSYLAVVVGLICMKNVESMAENKRLDFVKEIREGFNYSFSFLPLRTIIIIAAVIGFFGFPSTTLFPVFAKEVLKGDAQTLSLLTTSLGVGSLLSAIFMATRKSTAGLMMLVFVACIIYGLGFILFSYSHILVLSVGTLIMVGMGQVLFYSSCNSLLQTISDPLKTGRVISFYIMAFMGTTTLGCLIAGKLADTFGVSYTLFISGAGCLCTGFFLLFSHNSIRKRIIVSFGMRKLGV